MSRHRKRPVVIEAIELRAWDADRVAEWCGGEVQRSEAGHCTGIVIPTLEGDRLASLGDYVIQGVAGEFYPCKPDIFAQTYEEAA